MAWQCSRSYPVWHGSVVDQIISSIQRGALLRGSTVMRQLEGFFVEYILIAIDYRCTVMAQINHQHDYTDRSALRFALIWN